MISRMRLLSLSLFASLALAASAPALLPVPLAAQRGVPRTSPPAPEAEVYLVPLTVRGDTVTAGVPANLTRRPGYDNQPAFARDGRSLFYTSNRGDGHTDIYRYDLSTGLSLPVRRTAPESEYSAFPTTDGRAITVIRVEADSTQRLWQLPLDGAEPRVLFPDIKPVGYFAQPNDSTWALFVLGTPATLQLAYHGRGTGTVIARDIGRSLYRIPGTNRVSFVQKGAQPWRVMQLDPDTRRVDTLVALPGRSEDVVWMDSTTLLVGSGSTLHVWKRGTTAWQRVADFGFAHLTNITRLAVSPNRQWLAMVADATPRPSVPVNTSAAARHVDRIDPTSVQRHSDILAADSMDGRMTGSRGMERAARYLEAQYRAAGLEPAGDSGTYRQHIPLRLAQGPASAPGRTRPAPVASWAAWDSLPAEQRLRTQHIEGVLSRRGPCTEQ